MPGQYLYNVEFTVDDYDLWWYPEELNNAEEIPVSIRFQMNPSVCLDITDEEFIDQVNCDKKVIKNAMFSLGEEQVRSELGAKISAVVSECPGEEAVVGQYEFKGFHCRIQALIEKFDKNANEKRCGRVDICANQPSYEIIRELVQLVNDNNLPSGSIYYTLRLTCFGPTFIPFQVESYKEKEAKKAEAERECLDPSPTCNPPESKEPEYNEYSAEINGNQLIIRVHKNDKSHKVTRVFDTNMDQNGHEIKRDDNYVSICGCDQQIDFKFPEGPKCEKKKKKACDCSADSMLTDFQRQTSCNGSSFKNSCGLPVIRGNLKYPGRLDSGFIKFDVFDKCRPKDATEKYTKKPPMSRGACLQVDADNLDREINGKCKLPKGIEVCKKGCSDPDTDVFILKLGSKITNKKGCKNEIELEMRTPKAPDCEVKKMETREIQVNENEFKEDQPKKKEETKASPKALKGFVKNKK